MKKPILLRGHTLTAERALSPRSMSFKLVADGISTATMMLTADETGAQTGDWVRVYTPQGDADVYRVTDSSADYSKDGLRTVTLEHVLGALRDSVTGDKINDGQDNLTPAQALTTLLERQKEGLWTLGRCDFTEAQPWEFGNGKIWQHIQSVMNALEEPQIETDTTSLPFRLNLVRRPQEPSCGLRLNSGIKGITIKKSRSGMYTRLYATGAADITIASANGGQAYIERNVGLYGIIEEVADNQAIDNPRMLLQWARAQLARNSEPIYTITIDGAALAVASGLPFDKLTPGRVCRVDLPQYGVSIRQRITSLEWKDAIADEMAVKITLANEHRTVQGVVRQMEVEAVRARRGGAAAQKKGNEYLWTEIQNNDELIWLRAFRKDAQGMSLASLEITAGQIASAVTATGYADADGMLRDFSSRIAQNAKEIESRVTADQAQSIFKQEASGFEARLETAEGTIGSISLKTDSNGTAIANIKARLTTIEGDLNVGGKIFAQGDGIGTTGSIFGGGTVYGTTLNSTGGEIIVGPNRMSAQDLTVVTDFTQALGTAAKTEKYTVLASSVGIPVKYDDVAAGTKVTF